MTFEAFVREFAEWYAQNVLPPSWWGSAPMNLTTAFWLSRRRVSSAFLTINPDDRRPGWARPYIYPLYDWKTADIWTWFAKSKCCYNPLYDLMYKAGCRRVICASANRLARNSVRACGSIMSLNPNAGRRCVNAPAACEAEVFMPGTITILWPPEDPETRPSRLARIRHAVTRQHAAKYGGTLPQQNRGLSPLVSKARHERYSRHAGG